MIGYLYLFQRYEGVPCEELNANGSVSDFFPIDCSYVVYQGFEVDASGNTTLVGGAHTLWQK